MSFTDLYGPPDILFRASPDRAGRLIGVNTLMSHPRVAAYEAYAPNPNDPAGRHRWLIAVWFAKSDPTGILTDPGHACPLGLIPQAVEREQ